MYRLFASPKYLRETMVDADKTFSANKTQVALTTALTAARVLTLPAANSFAAGTAIIFDDVIGGITTANTVSVTRAGSDTINGLTTPFVLYTANVCFCLITDGTSKWTGGIVSTPSDGAWSNWTPTLTGASADPTGTTRYILGGKKCNVWINFNGNGTSNAVTKTITLPFTAYNGASQLFLGRGIDNSAPAVPILIATRSNSNIADVYASVAAGAWTALGLFRYSAAFAYETT